MVVEESKRLTLPPAVADWAANSLAWALAARVAEPPPLPSEEATASAWRPERRGDFDLELDLGVVMTTLGVKQEW